MLAGSFLNAKACAQAALRLGKPVMIICAGTQDTFSLEDGLCAGMIVSEIQQSTPSSIACNDFAKVMSWSYQHTAKHLEETLLQCENGVRLTQLGYKEDVVYCTNINHSTIVPSLHNQIMIALT